MGSFLFFIVDKVHKLKNEKQFLIVRSRFRNLVQSISGLVASLGIVFTLCFSSFTVANAATTSGTVSTGTTDFTTTYGCSGCHTSVTTYPNLANAANAGNIPLFMNGAAHLMGSTFNGSTTVANDISAYIASLVTTTATTISATYNTANTGVVTNVYTTSPTYGYTDLINTIATVAAPTKGAVSFVGAAPATITYTPTSGACGTDSFTYQGSASTGTMGTTSLRSISVTIGNPTVPSVTAGQTATGTYNTAYNPILTVAQTSTQNSSLCGATNFSATSVAYSATAVGYTTSTAAYPPGLTLNTSTGAISGTPTTAGTYTVPVYAINPGGASAAGSISITINKLTPTISAPSSGALVVGGTATVTASSPSPGAITLAASPSNICTISSTVTSGAGPYTGTATLTGVGYGISACTVTATQASTTNYNAPTSVPSNITVGQGSQSITYAIPSTVVVNPTTSTGTFSAVGHSSLNSGLLTGATYTYAASTGGGTICNVDLNTGAVTGLAVGTCGITATQSNTLINYVSLNGTSQNVTVGQGTQTVSFGASPSVAYLGSGTVSATASPSGLPVTFSTTSTACSVNSTSGLVNGLAAGSNNCVITATQSGNANYFGPVTATLTISVGLASQTIIFSAAPTSIIFSPTNSSTGSVSATSYDTSNTSIATGLAVTYSAAAGTGNCTVNSTSGAVVGTAGGTCVITANQSGDAINFQAATSVSQTITVNTASQTLSFGAVPSGIVVNPLAPTGGTVSATASPSGLAPSYSVVAGGTGICTVNSSTGAVTGIAAGTCVIAANQSGNANYSAASQITQTVTVGKGSQAIAFGAPPSLTFGSGSGTVSATANISGTATSSGLTVTLAVAPASASICSLSNVSGTTTVTATVNVNAAGTCTINATQAGDANYNAATLTPQTTTIAQSTQSISFNPAPSVNVGTTGLINAVATSGLAVTYISTTPSTCTVTGNTVRGLIAGNSNCTISSSQAGNSNFLGTTPATLTFSIGQGSQTITFGAAPTLKVTQTATVTATSSVGLPVVFSSTTPLICSVTGNTVTALLAGTCTVAANQPGDSNYAAASPITQNINVTNLPPTVHPASVSLALNTTGTFDLSADITGVGITGINVTSSPVHGTATVSGTKLSYTPNKDFFGTDQLTYMASGSGGTSTNSAVISITVIGRPDPTKDTRVTGIVNTQTAAVIHFGTVQVFNFQQRLESRHHAGYTSPSFNNDSIPSAPSTPIPTVSAPGTPSVVPTAPVGAVSNSGSNTPTTAGNASAPTPAPASATLPGQNFSSFNSWNPNSTFSLTNDPNSLLHSMDPTKNGRPSDNNPVTSLVANLVTGLATSSSLNLGAISNAVGSVKDDSFSRLDIWAAGNIRFGTSTSAGVDTRFATDGVSVGADKRFTRKLTMGMGMGYAVDNSTIGTDGTYSKSTGVSLAGYGSYQWDAGTFLDALLGYGKVDFDTNRYIPSVDDFARAARKGDQIFGSLSFGYDYRDDGQVISPYGRYDFSYDRLNAGTETGGGSNALFYDKQTVQSTSLSIGLRAQSAHQTDYGLVQPHARVEFQHSIQAVGDTTVAYADVLGTQYGIAGTTQKMNALVLGVGSDFLFSSSLKISLDYERLNSPGTENYESINFKLNKTLNGKNEFDSLMEVSYSSTVTKPTGFMVSAGFAYDSNITRASDAQDIRSDTIYSVSASKALTFTTSKFTRLKLSCFIDSEEFRTYTGLGHISGGGEGEFMYRTSGDFGAPTFGIFARYTDDAYESTLRDGTRSSVGVTLRQPLSDRISMFAAVASNTRQSNTEVFNTKDVSARANFDYAIDMGQTFYLTGEYRKGDIVSTGQGTLKALDMAAVTTPDDVFTSPQFQDYRMQGRTGLLTLGYNLSLGTKDSIDVSWRGVRSTPDYTPAYASPVSYTDNQYSIAYLMVF